MTDALTIQHVAIGNLRLDPFNPRRISDAELETLTRSIQEFGLVDPIIARREDRAVKDDGQPCGAPRLHDGEFCFWHSPEHADELAEAQRLGGLRRRKEKAVGEAYDIEGLDDVPKVRRLLEIAVLDTLALENSVARSRTLAYLAQVALKTLEVGELEERLARIEQAIAPRLQAVRGRR